MIYAGNLAEYMHTSSPSITILPAALNYKANWPEKHLEQLLNIRFEWILLTARQSLYCIINKMNPLDFYLDLPDLFENPWGD